MSAPSLLRRSFLSAVVAASMAMPWMARGQTAMPNAAPSLAGTWTLVAADKQLRDGAVQRDFGASPRGSLMIDQSGRYTLQIFANERPNFASGDKGSGTDEEMRAAVMGSSTHYGTLTVDWAAHKLRFLIEEASFPNWRGTVQERSFKLEGDTLSYKVAPRADGSVPISVWRRVRQGN